MVSRIYLQHPTQETLPLVREWTRDLAVGEDNIDWKTVWKNIFSVSKNANHQLIHFKVCQRAYHTPLLRYHMKFSPTLTVTCAR